MYARPHPFVIAAVAGLAATGATAQTTAAAALNRFALADAAVVLRVAAPAKWQQRFAKTQVVKLGQSNTLAPLMAQAGMMMSMGMDEVRQSGVFDADVLQGLLDDYRGDIVVSVQTDYEAMQRAMQFGETPPFTIMVALTPDGSFDLGAVASNFEQMVEKTKPDQVQLHDLTVGDLRLRHTANDDGEPDACLPTMVDGHLVMLIGNDIQKSAQQALGGDKHYTGELPDSPLFVHADLAPLMNMLMTAAAEDDSTPFDVGAILRAVGFGALRSLSLSIDTDGKHLVGDAYVGMAAKDRGIFDMMVADGQRPSLLKLLPTDAQSFSASRMDFAPIYRTVATIWGELSDMVPMTFEEAMGAFADAAKVRLKEDLLDHLGTEMLMVQDPATLDQVNVDDLEHDSSAMFDGSAYVLALRNGRAFGESLEKVLRSRGLHAGRKTEDYAGVTINRLRLAGLVELEYVVTDDALLVAAGKELSQRALRSVLDARAAGEGQLPESVQKHLTALPAGWNSVSATAVGPTLGFIGAVLNAGGELGPEGEMIAQVLRGLSSDIQRLGIDSMVSATYVTGDGLRTRFRW